MIRFPRGAVPESIASSSVGVVEEWRRVGLSQSYSFFQNVKIR